MKNKVLIPTFYFDPAYKSGGPIKSISEIVKLLSKVNDITVLTTNHDIDGELLSINYDELNQKYNSKIIYKDIFPNIFYLFNYLYKNKFEYVYLNSFFSIKECLYFVILSIFFKYKIIISIRGQLMEGALKKKMLIKRIYLYIFKLFFVGNIEKIHITNENELNNLVKYLGNRVLSKIIIIPNIKNINIKSNFVSQKEIQTLKIIYFSRIVPKKNLMFVLDILKTIDLSNVTLDIYGTIEDKKYWSLCLDNISKINLNICYKGVLNSENLVEKIKDYDLFFFPTFGENFGHVILESLEAGVPVLLSDATPFDNKNLDGAGWAYNLSEKYLFEKKILELYYSNTLNYQKIKTSINSFIFKFNKSNINAKNEYLKIFQ